MSINIDGRDYYQTEQPSQDVTDGALTLMVSVNRLPYVAIKPVLVT
ncbi:transposase [Escherichia coli]|nr:transposase [Escherichia coli]